MCQDEGCCEYRAGKEITRGGMSVRLSEWWRGIPRAGDGVEGEES